MKLLAEWFWIDRWVGSSAFLLPMEARGVYREMLTQAWRRQARLPSDPEAIRRAIGATTKEWARSWPRIKKFWRVDGDTLVNDTQLEVYAETLAKAQRASNRGKAGAQARLKHRSSSTQAEPESKPPVSVSVSVSRSNQVTSNNKPLTSNKLIPTKKHKRLRSNGNMNDHKATQKLLEKFVHESLDKDPNQGFADVKEHLKRLCSQRHLVTDPEIINNAVDAVVTMRQRKERRA